jgi:hypothetical protein
MNQQLLTTTHPKVIKATSNDICLTGKKGRNQQRKVKTTNLRGE